MVKYFLALSLLVQTMALAQPLIKVAVIDTGLNLSDYRFKNVLCKQGHKDFTGEGLQDYDGHGTHVAGLIKLHAGAKANYCLVILKYYAKKATSDNYQNYVAAIRYAVSEGVDLINYSGGGSGNLSAERNLILNNSGVRFVVAAGNDNQDLANYEFYPARYGFKNLIVVGSLKAAGVKADTSNYGKYVNAWEVGEEAASTLNDGSYGTMSGTSMAAAIHTGRLVSEW